MVKFWNFWLKNWYFKPKMAISNYSGIRSLLFEYSNNIRSPKSGRNKLTPSKVVCLALETLKLNWIKLNIFLTCHCNIRKVSWYKLVTSSPSSRIASTTIFKDWQEQNNEHWNWKKRKSFNVIIVAICFPTFSILAAHSSNLIIEIEN